MVRKYFSLWVIVIAMAIVVIVTSPVQGQLPLLPKISLETLLTLTFSMSAVYGRGKKRRFADCVANGDDIASG